MWFFQKRSNEAPLRCHTMLRVLHIGSDVLKLIIHVIMVYRAPSTLVSSACECPFPNLRSGVDLAPESSWNTNWGTACAYNAHAFPHTLVLSHRDISGGSFISACLSCSCCGSRRVRLWRRIPLRLWKHSTLALIAFSLGHRISRERIFVSIAG